MSAVQVLRRSPDRVPKDPESFWLSRLDSDTVPVARSNFRRWMRWLHTKQGWETATPRELLVRQLQSEDPYEVLDLVQEFIGTLVARKSSKGKTHWAVTSFFRHNRCALPVDPSFKIRGDRPPVEGRLSVPDIIEAYHAATLRYRSIILFQWQSMLDNSRLIWMNQNRSDEVVRQLQQGTHPVQINMPGRKENENDTRGRFYTFIGKDAADALVKYFDEERGWPKPGEPIWIQSNRKPLHKPTMEATWLRLFRRIGKVPRQKGPLGSRYGFNQHEIRDVATSYLHVNAKADGLDMDCIHLWCGQVGQIDPLRYDKFYQNRPYVSEQYQIAEKYLNIISNPAATHQADELSKKNRELTKRIEQLEAKYETLITKKIRES